MALRSYTPEQSMLTQRRRVEVPLLLMVGLSVVAFSLAEGQWAHLLLGIVAVGVNLWAARHDQEVFVSRLLVNIGVVAACGIFVLELLTGRGTLVILSPLGHFLILIQLCKLFEQKRNRDYIQLVALSGLLMLAAALITQEIWYAALLLTYLVLICHTAMALTLKRGLDAAAAQRLSGEAGPMPLARVAWDVSRDWPTRPIARYLAVMIVFAMFCGLLTFLAAPRVDELASKAFATLATSVSGMSSSVSLDQPRRLELSGRLAMEVELEPSNPSVQLPSILYLRGRTFSDYSASRWSNPQHHRAMMTKVPPPEEMLKDVIVQHFRIHGSQLPMAYAIAPIVKATSPDGRTRINWNSMTLESPGAAQRWVRYTAYSMASPLSPGQLNYLQMVQRHYAPALRAPDEGLDCRPAVAQLAQQWCKDLLQQRQQQPSRRDELDLAIAQRVAQHLRNEYAYSLDFTDAEPSRDGVEDFLFHMKHGHCEYFASALTVMSRSLGVQARLATGYQLDESSREGNRYVVRDRDAHAWCEVYTPQSDWVIVDATPAGGGSHRQQSVWQRIRQSWDDMRQKWLGDLMAFDATRQRELTQNLLSQLKQAWQWALHLLGQLGQSFYNLLEHGEVDVALMRFLVVVGAVGLGLEALLLVRLRRRDAQQRAKLSISARHVRYMAWLFEMLEKHGVFGRSGQTLREIALQGALELGLPARQVNELIDLYYRLRWGRRKVDPAQIASAEQTVQAWRRQLAQKGKV